MTSPSVRSRAFRASLATVLGAAALLSLAACQASSKGTPPGPIRPNNSMPVISVPTMAFGQTQSIQVTLGSTNTVALVAFETSYLDSKLDVVSQGTATAAPIAWFGTKGTAGGKPLLDRNTTSSLTHALDVASASAQPTGTVPANAVYARVTLGYLDGSTATKADPDDNAVWEVTIVLPTTVARAPMP